MTRSLLPGFWLTFSLVYSRGNYREFLATWGYFLAAAFVVPIGIALGFRSDLVTFNSSNRRWRGVDSPLRRSGRVLNVLYLIAAVMILSNFEKTFRSTVGTMRWRIKYRGSGSWRSFLPARIYTLSQDLLFSHYDLTLTNIETGALLIGCAMMTIGYFRSGIAEIDVYPSRSVLQGTVTVLLAGGYLFVIGLLAQLIALLGGAGNFKTQAFLVLLGIAVWGCCCFPNGFDRRFNLGKPSLQAGLSTIFARYGFFLRRRISGVLDPDAVCSTAAKLISETFNVLSVTIWRVDERKECSFSERQPR